MTAVDVPTDRLDALEAKLDLLTQQMALLTADVHRREREREAFDDLRRDLTRVSEGAMELASRELETLEADPADVVRLLRRFVEAAPTLERALVALDQMSELFDDVAPLAPSMMTSAASRLEELQRRGYFDMATAAVAVVDRVVTNFDEDDVAQLGENVVTMLETLKEITQPEMLAMASHVVDAVRRQQHVVELEPEEPPSLWALLRQLRDPDVRRGMARALGTLQAVSKETGPRYHEGDS